jgi:uncharacterized protein YecT (DUF1311 family)
MSNADFTPELSGLDKDYQILTELHREERSRTYLARHLQLNRDVTITVIHSDDADNGTALTYFAADARLLMTMRHPNVIPVIEGRWLDDWTFALVRARVRGSTLDQLISAVDPVPIPRVATTIQNVHAALTWARNCGIVHRNVSAQSIVFQQGNGRTLLSFEPATLPADAMPDECDDAHTVGRLASEMLSGQIDGREEHTSAVIVPPQIVPAVARAIERVRVCNRSSAPPAIDELLSALQSAVGSAPPMAEPVVNASAIEAPVVVERVVERVVEPAADVAVMSAGRATRDSTGPARKRLAIPVAPRRSTAPIISPRDAVVEVHPTFGFNARLGTAVAVGAIIGVLSLIVVRERARPDLTASTIVLDTTRQAAGDIASASARPETASTTLPIVPRSPIMPPDAPRHEPPRTAPPSTSPLPSASTATTTRDSASKSARIPERIPDSANVADRRTSRDSAASSVDADACTSSEAADQRKCLLSAIDRNDRDLKAVYAKLIAALRRQARTAAEDPDPEAVEQLRTAQRAWIDERDTACREVGTGPLYARERSSCFAQESANRTRELQKMLIAIPPSF